MRVEYALTDRGRELDGIFAAMQAWGEKWAICVEPEAPSANRRDAAPRDADATDPVTVDALATSRRPPR